MNNFIKAWLVVMLVTGCNSTPNTITRENETNRFIVIASVEKVEKMHLKNLVDENLSEVARVKINYPNNNIKLASKVKNALSHSIDAPVLLERFTSKRENFFSIEFIPKPLQCTNVSFLAQSNKFGCTIENNNRLQNVKYYYLY